MVLEEVSDFIPRSYQDQLLEVALRSNTIIYLPTGAGKTHVAIMAIKHMSKDLVGSIKDGAKRTVFLCNTIVLAKQQAEVLKKMINLQVSVYTGDMNVDGWKRGKWEDEFDKNQVIVATCQIIVDVVRHNFIGIDKFNLMIFDECHHAKGEHPMHQLLSQFQHYNPNKLPRVIGLTGILITGGKKNTIVQEMEKLEAIYRAKIATCANVEEYQNVLVYSTKPKENVVKYIESPPSGQIIEKIVSLVEECKRYISSWKVDETHFKLSKNFYNVRLPNPITRNKLLFDDFIYQLKDMGLYAASVAIMAVLVELETKKRSSETLVSRNLYRICVTYADRIRHVIVKEIYNTEDSEEEIIYDNSTQKLNKLFQYLKMSFTGKKHDEIKCLVFVERRRTAKCLYHVIKRWVDSINNLPIVPEFMVGHTTSMAESIESILEEKWNRDVLTSFKRNTCNIIVASSVLEEGIDIQSCNNVIIFDPLKTFRSYIQTKGRARMSESFYTIFIPENKYSESLAKIREYQEIDILVKNFLIGKTIDRQIPLLEETEKQFEQTIPPFHSKTGARLEGISAVQLLNRYCQQLPNDSFTKSSVIWSKVNMGVNKLVIKVLLPIQSSVKHEIKSPCCDSVRIGKQWAAYNACIELYKNGEFTENLLPISKKMLLNKYIPMYFNHWNEYEDDDRLAGTQRKKRIHDIKYPKELYSALPIEGVKSYLYLIKVTPKFDVNSTNEHVFHLLQTSNNYAILTSKPLPKLAAMPLFMSQGLVLIEICTTPIEIIIDKNEDIISLRNFHIMIFKDILEIWKSFFAYDFSNEENSFLIVPTTDGKQIHWELVKKFQYLSVCKEKSELQRKRMTFNATDYLHNVVTTWYSLDNSVRYVVDKIREDLQPTSPFPNETYKDYASYVESKYEIQVIQKSAQFLIEVKPLTARMNFFMPGCGEDGSRKKKRLEDDIILIPELCHNYHYPGDMWIKAHLIPSILHRLHYLLLSEELRLDINNFLNLPVTDYSPHSLIVDKSLNISDEENEQKKGIQAEILPNPKKTPIREVFSVDSIIETSVHPWKPYEEPVDLERNQDVLHEVELDYYVEFINNKLKALGIIETDEDQKLEKEGKLLEKMECDNLIKAVQIPREICDVPLDEKLRINILEKNERNWSTPEQCQYMCALTAASAGDVFNMERYELLGDAFLKFGVSLFLLHEEPTLNEGQLTALKGKFVSNQNLFYCAVRKGLPGMLGINVYKPRHDFAPPLMKVPANAKTILLENKVSADALWELKISNEEIENGKVSDHTLTEFKCCFPRFESSQKSWLYSFIGKQQISDKVCADSIEAILGVCLSNYGPKQTLNVLKYFEILPQEKDLSDLIKVNLGTPRLKTNISDKEIDGFLINYKDLENGLGYQFRDRAYLLQALTHPSFPTNRLTGCYQQLEFLGDAVLDFLISSYVFERFQDMDPGKLTDLRSALVNNVTLACLTVRYKFHSYMLSQNAALSQSILKFYNFQQKQKFKVTDQVRILLQEGELKENALADFVDVPKAMGDIFESLIGAVFLDSGNDLKLTWSVIYNLMKNEINEFSVNVPIQLIRQLYEFNGANPDFSDPITNDEDVMVKCRFTCRDEIREVYGFGHNKENAKVSAAKLALQQLLRI